MLFALLGFVLLAALTGWEVRHPVLPMTFELGAADVAARSAMAARLPGALTMLAAVVALGLVVVRTVSRTAAVYAVAALVTTPLAFLAARVAMVHASRAAAGMTFEHAVPALAYGLGPWAVVAPFALAGRLRAPSAAWWSAAAALVLALLVVGTRAYAVSYAIVTPLLAAAIGIELARTGRRPPSTTLAAAIAGIGWLVVHDLQTAPERLLAPLLDLGETDRAVITAAATHAAKIAVPILGAASALVALLAWLPGRYLPGSRGLLVAAVASAAGLGLRLVVYPQLLARSSPSASIEAWSQRRGPGEPLAALGIDRRELDSVKRATGEALVELPSATAAGTWLAVPPADGARRWLAMLPATLPEVNAAYRASRGANVPLLVGGDEATFLATSALHRGETSVNPLERTVPALPPPGLTPFDAEIGDELTVLGYRLVDANGKVVTSAVRHRGAGRETHLQVVLRVEKTPAEGICTFVHADRNPSRFAAEHRELPYPVRWWTPGEIVVDDFPLSLPADFSAGHYPLFWGVGILPCEDDRRRDVTRGPSDGHGRVSLSELEVR